MRKVCLIVAFIVWVCATQAAGKELLNFEGTIDFSTKEFDLILNLGKDDYIKAKAQRNEKDDLHVQLNVEHLKTPIFDISSEVQSLIEVINSHKSLDKVIQGKIWSQYSLIDYKPIKELKGRFEINDQQLHLSSFSVGNLQFHGLIDLVSPYKLELNFELDSIEMQDFLNFWFWNNTIDSEGLVSGDISVTGNLSRPLLKGNLQTFDGFVDKLKYDHIFLHIEGLYPHMQIAQSTLSEQAGMSFSFGGPFDLSNLKNFKKQVKDLKFSPMVSDSESEVEWTIRRYQETESSVTELKYLKRKELPGTSQDGENSDMLGIERKVEF